MRKAGPTLRRRLRSRRIRPAAEPLLRRAAVQRHHDRWPPQARGAQGHPVVQHHLRAGGQIRLPRPLAHDPQRQLRVCYAQWSDCRPVPHGSLGSMSSEMSAPQWNLNRGAGPGRLARRAATTSPWATRTWVDWKFIEYTDMPAGPVGALRREQLVRHRFPPPGDARRAGPEEPVSPEKRPCGARRRRPVGR